MRTMSRYLMITVLLAVLGAAIGIFWIAEVDSYSVAPRAERQGGSCPIPPGDLRRQDRLAGAETKARAWDKAIAAQA